MRAPRRLLAVLLVAAIGLLALAFSGLFSWISSVLFLLLELIADSLRPLIGRPTRPRTRGQGQVRDAGRARSPSLDLVRRGARPRRRGRPRSLPAHLRDDPEPAPLPPPAPEPTPGCRVLVPLMADRPGLLDFALVECRDRRAELVLLYLRPLAVTPMGPNPLPSLAEDGPARALFDRLARRAREAGVPLRTLYRVTRDVPATILETARVADADIVLMEAGRRNLLARALWGDEIRSLLRHLPGEICLVLHNG